MLLRGTLEARRRSCSASGCGAEAARVARGALATGPASLASIDWCRLGGRRWASQEQAAWCSGRVVARAAAVGNAVAARQVIVIGAAVPLAPRPPSRRAHAHSPLCVWLAHRSFFSRSRRRLTPRRCCRRRRSRFLRCSGWRPLQGRPAEVGASGGGGRCTPFFFKSFSFFSRIFCVSIGMKRSLLFYFILYLYIVIINSDDAHERLSLPKRWLNDSFVFD